MSSLPMYVQLDATHSTSHPECVPPGWLGLRQVLDRHRLETVHGIHAYQCSLVSEYVLGHSTLWLSLYKVFIGSQVRLRGDEEG